MSKTRSILSLRNVDLEVPERVVQLVCESNIKVSLVTQLELLHREISPRHVPRKKPLSNAPKMLTALLGRNFSSHSKRKNGIRPPERMRRMGL